MRRLLALLALCGCACGGSPAPAAQSGAPATETARPVRVDAPAEEASATAARPVRVEATAPGEVSESEELASPPPVEAPTSHL